MPFQVSYNTSCFNAVDLTLSFLHSCCCNDAAGMCVLNKNRTPAAPTTVIQKHFVSVLQCWRQHEHTLLALGVMSYKHQQDPCLLLDCMPASMTFLQHLASAYWLRRYRGLQTHLAAMDTDEAMPASMDGSKTTQGLPRAAAFVLECLQKLPEPFQCALGQPMLLQPLIEVTVA